MRKRTYIANLTEKDIYKLLKGRKIRLKYLNFNLEIEKTEHHRISCLSKLYMRAGKMYK